MSESNNAVTVQENKGGGLLATMAAKFGVEPTKMLTTLKATAFKGDVTNEQMMALLIVANQHGLNPWTKEIYAFPDKGGIVPVVGVDGWSRIINGNPQFDGIEFVDGDDEKGNPVWCECTIYRKDRKNPTKVREYMAEVKRNTGPWTSHPRRMLRHKSLIQCARLAFGYGGIYDQDEAERIIAKDEVLPPEKPSKIITSKLKEVKEPLPIIDVESETKQEGGVEEMENIEHVKKDIESLIGVMPASKLNNAFESAGLSFDAWPFELDEQTARNLKAALVAENNKKVRK